MKSGIKGFIRLSAFITAIFTVLTLMSCGKDKTDGEVGNDKDTGDNLNVPLNSFTVPMPDNINPLTGLEASYDVSTSRPIAVMLNNIYQALPQVGISKADILFECLAEGGITRLMGLFSEYNELGVIGSVRSSRPYYIDFAQMFDAIYCHAGGSEDAYSQMSSRQIDHIDGVRGDPLGVYYRDQDRLQSGYSTEHTMMTTGEGIIKTIEYCSFRTDLRDGYEYPFEFSKWDEEAVVGKDDALHIYLPISYYQNVDYIYDSESKTYLRYQYDGEKHIDGENGEQLAFKNVIILFCDTAVYDDYGRLRVTTTGTGDGYLASDGKYKSIKWSRSTVDGNLLLTDSESGETVTVNRGKTFINVCSSAIYSDVNMNASERTMDDGKN